MKFSASPARAGKSTILPIQVLQKFRNSRHSRKGKATRAALALAQGNNQLAAGSSSKINPSAAVHTSSSSGMNPLEGDPVEYEAKSKRNGAWYDVDVSMSNRKSASDELEVLVHFSGFGPEEVEWVNAATCLRQRSLPCRAMECIAVLPGDLVLCYKKSDQSALYFDARVISVGRQKHDSSRCDCRFLVRYEHDQSKEFVSLREVCRRPENNNRLQVSHVPVKGKK